MGMRDLVRGGGARSSLLMILLTFELVVVFLVALTAWGLKATPGDPIWALVGGGVVMLVMVAAILFVNSKLGLVLGTACQIAIVVSGIFVTANYVVGLVFLGLWVFAYWQGTKLDAQKAAWYAQNARAEAATDITE